MSIRFVPKIFELQKKGGVTMNVGMVNGYIGIQNYRMPNITKTEEVNQNTEVSLNQQVNGQTTENVTQMQEERKPVFTDLEDISLGFNKQDDFSYIGKDADIEQLDMQKAISDMKKDNLFHQYQFFVRSSMFGNN